MVITGAAGGIGAALSRRLSAAGTFSLTVSAAGDVKIVSSAFDCSVEQDTAIFPALTSGTTWDVSTTYRPVIVLMVRAGHLR